MQTKCRKCGKPTWAGGGAHLEQARKKLGVSFRKYRILGACKPSLAHEALQKNLGVGVMMPCNVVVYEDDDGSAVVMRSGAHRDSRLGNQLPLPP